MSSYQYRDPHVNGSLYWDGDQVVWLHMDHLLEILQCFPWTENMQANAVPQRSGVFKLILSLDDMAFVMASTSVFGREIMFDHHDWVSHFCCHNGWLVGLDLFNDDTRPSGHISCPTQVNVSQSCFHSLNNYSELLSFSKQLFKSDHIVQSWGLVEVHIR